MRFTPNSLIAAWIAILSASVPPEVNIISEERQFICFAIERLEVSTKAFAFLPKKCVEDGLPKFSFKTSNIESITSGAI